MSYSYEYIRNITEENLTCAETGEVLFNRPAYKVIDDDGEATFYSADAFNEKFFVCEDCGELFIKDDEPHYDTEDGGIVCENCFCIDYVECEECSCAIRTDEAITAYKKNRRAYWQIDEVYVCSECLHDHYYACEHCGSYHHNDITSYDVIVDNYGTTETWCDRCSDESARYCAECGDLYDMEIMEWDDDADDYVCEGCSGGPKDWGYNRGDIKTYIAPNFIMDYCEKPDACFCPSYDESTIYYGFELEVEASSGTNPRSYVNDVNSSGYTYIKHDGSLSHGMEIVSHPATLQYHMEKMDAWKEIFRKLRRNGFTSHDAGSCGLHVHASLAAMEEANPFAVHNLIILFDRFWENLVKFSRRTNRQLDHWAKRYCVPASEEYALIKSAAKREWSRYMAINLQNFETVEFRLFRGSLKLKTFYATLQLVDTLVKKAIELGGDADKVRSITWEELVRSDYKELNDYLTERGLAGGTPATEVTEETEDAADIAAGC